MPQPDRLLWRSDFGWSPHSPAGRADPKSGLVIHYDSSDQRLADKPHSECVAYWQRTRRFHTGPARGWADIGYSFMACAHGYVLEGRGLFRTQAAQPGGNTTHYSVTLATGPTDEITPGQINAVRQLREWLMEPTSSIAGTVKGHRDFVPTSCPGDKAYALVRSGAFARPAVWGGGVPDLDEPEPAPTPGTTAPPFPLPGGHWFGPESSDPRNHSGYWTADRPHIRAIRDRLRQRGWSVATGDRYDARLGDVIGRFQAEKGLVDDGLVGERTWPVLWTAPIT